MTTAYRNAAPHWLTDAHEMPVNPGENPPALWSENYLMYVWSPANAVGIYWHLCRTLGEIPIWNEQLVVALPGGRYLASKGQSRGEVRPASLSVVGLQVSVNIPFRRLNVSFRGGARLLSRDEFHSCPVQDGAHVPVDINLGFDSMSPPFDLGSGHLDQAWAVGHFEQHGRIVGSLRFGDEAYPIDGTGLRDHSWGARDYKNIGSTNWLHAQFPNSGRSLMAVLVSGIAPKPELRYAITSDGETIQPVQVEGLAPAMTLEETLRGYELNLVDASGKASCIRAEILDASRAALVGPSEISLGTYTKAQANHHYIDAFTRFDWDGETGYGVTERTVDLTKG